MALAPSNQAIVEDATVALRAAIAGSTEFASWIGFEAVQQGLDLQTAINIVHEIEAGHYTLDDLFIASQTKTLSAIPTDIAGEPDPSLTVLGHSFDIGHLLGATTVETWQNGTGKSSTFHSREFFTTIGTDAPDNYVDGWENPTPVNHDPVALADTLAINEDTVVLNGTVAGNDSDADLDTLTFTLDDPAPNGLTFNPDGSYSFNAGHADYQHLAEGVASDPIVVNYTVNDGHGGLAHSTLTIVVTGTNDKPTITTIEGGNADKVTEAGHLDSGAVNAGDPDASGKLSATDIDDGSTVEWSGTADGNYGSFAIDKDGNWTFALDQDAADHLAEGASDTQTFTATVTDDKGATETETVTINIIGTNDKPVAVADTNAGLEDDIITGDLKTNDSDVDDGATLHYKIDGAVAGLTINDDGTYSFDASHEAYQDLHLGKTQVVEANYIVTDEHGASATSTLSITLTGTADEYHAETSKTFTKSLDSAQTFSFELPVEEDAFNFTNASVTLTLTGDVDGKNEHATVQVGAELDELLKLTGTLNNADDVELANVTLSDSTGVSDGAYDNLSVDFDVALSGQVGIGSTITAHLVYDYWA